MIFIVDNENADGGVEGKTFLLRRTMLDVSFIRQMTGNSFLVGVLELSQKQRRI